LNKTHQGIEAEVELISAIVASFEGLGITSDDVGIKINSRKILNGLMEAVGIPKEKWVQTCILVDKLEKVPVSALQDDLNALGISKESVEELLESLKMNTIEQFEEKLGSTSEGVVDIKRMLTLAEAYGVKDWLQFDASVVRGLAYYTGVVFEGFDKSGELRAICGGGRYDLLLSSLSNGKDSICAVGFGFGDAVIVELLKMKNTLPDFSRNEDVDVVMYAMPSADPEDTAVAFKAAKLATDLRKSGKTVYMVLDSRKPKWVFQKADKLGASAVVVLGSDEDTKGGVTIKSLATGEQAFCKYEDVLTTI
jgi:histidyl-tRNA synthetase